MFPPCPASIRPQNTQYNIYTEEKISSFFVHQSRAILLFLQLFFFYIPHPAFPGTYITQYTTFPHAEIKNHFQSLTPSPLSGRRIIIS